MIIRKPFAFLVEKFKLLHFIILLPCIYLIYMFWRLSDFFNTFVLDGYVTTIADVSNKYYSFLMIIATLFIVVFSLLVVALFKRKNKFYLPYLILEFIYIAIFVITLFIPGFLHSAELAELESSTSLILRGMMSIAFYVQIISAIAIILLAFGLNFKTGEFIDIRDEINLDEEDSEEVEINIKSDDYRFKRFIRRYFREIKYYIIENKNVFKVLGGIVGVIILFFLVRFIISLNRIVRIDQAFGYSNFSISFNSSILSTLDYNGNKISDGKIYLANKVSVTNRTNGLLTLKTDDFCLEIAGECYYPKLDRSGKFIDLAKPYYAEAIGGGKTYEYAIVYELDEALTKSKYKVKILDSLTYKKNEVIPKYKEITLNPSFSDSINNVADYNLGDEINLSKTNLLNTTLRFSDYNISQFFRYDYDYCYNDNCTKSQDGIAAGFGKYFIILDGTYNLDENSSYSKYKLGSNDFFEDFTDIEYEYNGNKYYLDVKDVTPKKVNDKVVLEVNSSIKNAENKKLLITVRDQRYILNLEKKEKNKEIN